MKIYTLGERKNYLKFVKDGKKKLGPREYLRSIDGPYPGGICFSSIEKALAYREKKNKRNYSVFELEGDFNEDAVYNKKLGYYTIKRDLKIMREVAI